MIRRFFVTATQLISWPLFALVSLFVVKSHSRAEFSPDKDGCYVFAINHVSRLDPFLVFGSLQISCFIHVAPLMFFVANVYYNKLYLRPFLWLLGGFRAYPHKDRVSGLDLAAILLEHNHNIVIFPEGKVRRTAERLKAKRGIAELAKLQDVQVVPIYIKRSRGLLRAFKITYGPAERMQGLDAEAIMQKVYDLDSLTPGF